jgi:hypothetical protein
MANQAPNKGMLSTMEGKMWLVIGIESYADVCTVQERLTQVEGHLLGGSGSPGSSGTKGKKSLLEKNPDDVSI